MHRRDRMPLKHLSDTEFLEVQNIYNEIEYKWKTWESKKG